MNIDDEGRHLLTLDDLRPLIDNDCIKDVTSGGLLLGNSHNDGGIIAIRQFNLNHYEIFAEFEGWEFILNANATKYFLQELHQLNDEMKGQGHTFVEYLVPPDISVLDARPIFPDDLTTGKVLIVGSSDQYIINRHSTKKYLCKLDEMNRRFPSTLR